MKTENLAVVSAERLLASCVAILVRLGVPDADARLTADVFVDSDLRGEESHGMRLLIHVLARLKHGGASPRPTFTVERDHAAIAVIDSHHSIGQVAAAHGMQLAIKKAREFGIGAVSIRNSNSYTSTKYYSLMAVRENMIGITYTNSIPMMPPPGGITPTVGNNPVSISAPAGEEDPFVLDMAVATAMEKIRQAEERGYSIPEGWALDRTGNRTIDPTEALASGILLPFGGYKAFGLGVCHEIMTSVLAGGLLFTCGSKGFFPYDEPMNVSQYFQAINIQAFTPLVEFKSRMDEMIRRMRSSELAPGSAGITLPGERGRNERIKRMREGIPIPLEIYEELREWANEVQSEPITAAAIIEAPVVGVG